MCHDCLFFRRIGDNHFRTRTGYTGNRFERLDGYDFCMPYFYATKFSKKYWCIQMAHGHTTHTIIRQLKQAIRKLEKKLRIPHNQQCEYPTGYIGKPHPVVLLILMRDLYNMCIDINKKYPNETIVLFSDQVFETIPYHEEGYESEGYWYSSYPPHR